MSYTVFYSWQDDTDKKVNHDFLKDVLSAAVKKIGVELEEKPSVISDTTGVPGSPSIVETIFDRIKNCDVYVPDLTFVATTKKGKKISNPNVLIELGFASGVIGDKIIIPILNENYGEVGGISFNRRHIRFPVTYRLAPNSTEKEKKSVKNNLINDMAGYIQLALQEGVLKKEVEIIEKIDDGEISLILSDCSPSDPIARREAIFETLQKRTKNGTINEIRNFIKYIKKEYLPFYVKKSDGRTINYVIYFEKVTKSLLEIKKKTNRKIIIKLIDDTLEELKFSGLAPVESLEGYLFTYKKLKEKALNGRVVDMLDLINFLKIKFFPTIKLFYGGSSKYNEFWLEVFGENGIISQIRERWKYPE